MIKTLLLIIIALLGIPAGLIISKYTKEELKAGKKWFKVLMIITLIIILGSFFLISDISQKSIISTVSAFIFFLSLVSYRKA